MTAKCPWCGAKPSADPKFAGFGFNQPGRFGYHVFECGYSTNAAHNTGCRNRDERTTRDETTQPPEAEEPEAMSQTTETTETTQEVVAYPEVSTLPAIKPLADAALKNLGLALAVVERLKGYGQLVLVDLADRKAAKDLNEKRLEVWRASVAWRKACKEGRADANAIADAWVKAEKSLVKDFDEVEAHLEKQLEAHEKELARIAKEAADALKAKIQARLDAMTAAGIPVDLARASDLSDEDWSDYLSKALDAKAKLDAATKVADELTALGDECTPGEALQLTDDQIEHRMGVARKADYDRKEAARIQAEEAAAEAERVATEAREKAEQEARDAETRRRFDLLTSLGQPVTMERCASALPEEFEEALGAARRRVADALALQQAAAKVPEPVVERPAPSFAIDPIAPAVVDAIQATESQEIEDALAAPTPSAQVVAWFAGIRTAIEASPDKEPDTLAAIAKMLDAVQEVEDAFLPF